MKYLLPEDQLRLARLAERRFRARIKRKNLRQRRLLRQDELRAIQKAFQVRYDVPGPRQKARLPIMIPERLSLRENYKETVQMIVGLRDAVLRGNTPIQLYFDRVRYLEPAATLLLVAEIFRCRQLRKWRGGHTVMGNYPSTSEIFFQLREMGFYQVLDVDERESVPDGRPAEDRPHFIRFRTMNSVIPRLAADFGEVVSRAAFAMNDLAKKRMVAALKEAMGNAHEHAYERPGDYPVMPKRWWLAGHLHPANREMMIMILDQGIGIPNTLEPTIFEQLAALLKLSGSPTDAKMIQAATELHRTSTGKAGRGQGFQDMKRFVDTCDDGELWVVSNRGAYTYMKEDQAISENESSIGGTLIQWRIRHARTVEVNDE